MRKRWFLVGMMFLLLSWLLVGCGIAQEVHNAVVAERDAAQAQVTTLQSDLSSAQGQVKTLESDLSVAQAQITTLESDLSTAQAQTTTLESDLSTAESRVTILEGDLDAANTEFQSFKSGLTLVWTSLEKKLDSTLVFTDFLNIADKAEYGLITEEEAMQFATNWLINTGVSVNAVGDAELSQLWQDLWLYAAEEDEVQIKESFTSMVDLLMDLVKDDVKTMKSKLAR